MKALVAWALFFCLSAVPARAAGPAFLGVSLSPLNEQTRAAHSVPDSVTQGAVITGIVPHSCAAQAGLTVGDVVVSFDGKKVEGPEALAKLIHAHEAGDQVSYKVRRGAGSMEGMLTLGSGSGMGMGMGGGPGVRPPSPVRPPRELVEERTIRERREDAARRRAERSHRERGEEEGGAEELGHRLQRMQLELQMLEIRLTELRLRQELERMEGARGPHAFAPMTPPQMGMKSVPPAMQRQMRAEMEKHMQRMREQSWARWIDREEKALAEAKKKDDKEQVVRHEARLDLLRALKKAGMAAPGMGMRMGMGMMGGAGAGPGGVVVMRGPMGQEALMKKLDEIVRLLKQQAAAAEKK